MHARAWLADVPDHTVPPKSNADEVAAELGDLPDGPTDLTLRYLGLGLPTTVPVDEQGRILPRALEDALANGDDPTIVTLQAGNLHSGAFDPLGECADGQRPPDRSLGWPRSI